MMISPGEEASEGLPQVVLHMGFPEEVMMMVMMIIMVMIMMMMMMMMVVEVVIVACNMGFSVALIVMIRKVLSG